MLPVGCFQGLTSQHGMAWHCPVCLSLPDFLGLPANEESPDNSSLTRIRNRLPQKVHNQLF
jgi:transposase